MSESPGTRPPLRPHREGGSADGQTTGSSLLVCWVGHSGHSSNFFCPESRWGKGRGDQNVGPQRRKDTGMKNWGKRAIFGRRKKAILHRGDPGGEKKKGFCCYGKVLFSFFPYFSRPPGKKPRGFCREAELVMKSDSYWKAGEQSPKKISYQTREKLGGPSWFGIRTKIFQKGGHWEGRKDVCWKGISKGGQMREGKVNFLARGRV